MVLCAKSMCKRDCGLGAKGVAVWIAAANFHHILAEQRSAADFSEEFEMITTVGKLRSHVWKGAGETKRELKFLLNIRQLNSRLTSALK